MFNSKYLGVLSSFWPLLLVGAAPLDSPLRPVVELEETVYTYVSANNGAGPMWCAGSTCLFRSDDRLYATGLETVPDAKPLNNCRWVLFERSSPGWQRRYVDDGLTREPAPLVGFDDGRVWVSGNPTLGTGPEPGGGPAKPELWAFSGTFSDPPTRHFPEWKGTPSFREHSYRSFAADGPNAELIILQNIGYGYAEWSFRDADGQWPAKGQLQWPIGHDYEPTIPVRLCYPNVALVNRAVHFFGIGDIVEPNPTWRQFKHELTGNRWDYVFRRLYYAWTPDIIDEPFSSWTEIASREATAGFIWPCDLWIDGHGRAHLLWTERALDERLRERFFPEGQQSHTLNYAVIEQGKEIRRHRLLESTDSRPGLVSGRARFHVLPNEALLVVAYVSGTDVDGRTVAENRVGRIDEDGTLRQFVTVPLERPFTNFFTATPRGGSKPSNILEFLGTVSGGGQAIGYAKVRIEP